MDDYGKITGFQFQYNPHNNMILQNDIFSGTQV